MAEKKSTEEKLTLNELIMRHANACAEKGDKQKAGAYRDIVDEMSMPTMQAIQAEILKDGISSKEIIGLLLAAITRG